MEKIKLIIWDLDDTIWSGTLDEGDVYLRQELVDIVKKLNDHGIINSICSKNDYDKTKLKLEHLGIWEEFVSPRISWSGKGQIVKEMIEQLQLRASNVLFIDDNELNLEEVKYYNTHINVLNIANSDFMSKINDVINNSGKFDNRKRFYEYKIIENKIVEKEKYSDNREFLKQSKIKVKIEKASIKYLDRIDELVNRTNQLNFTKNRMNKNELESILYDKKYYNFLVFANDKFGDYGLIGFVTIDLLTNFLVHFVFSCRTLNMGIEQYIYSKIGFPKLNIIGDVSTKLIKNNTPDWITEVLELDSKILQQKNNILLIGGCDLYQLSHYIGSESNIDYYFNCASTKYNAELHRDSINFLYASKVFDSKEKELILKYFPLADENFFRLPSFANYDIIIYSPLIDYVQKQYSLVDKNNIVISWGDFTRNVDEDLNLLQKMKIDENELISFEKRWIEKGPITADEFINKLKSIFKEYSRKLIILNGATNNIPNYEKKYLSQHLLLNKALEQFVKDRERETILIDINELVSSEDDFTDSIRHYKKHIYKKIADLIVKSDNNFNNVNFAKVTFRKLLKRFQS